MSKSSFVLHYQNLKNVEFSTANTARKYIESEAAVWNPFFQYVKQHNSLDRIQTSWRQIDKSELLGVFDALLRKLDNSSEFGEYSQSFSSGVALPPPSHEIEGQLILGLFNNGREYDALAAYLSFINKSLSFTSNGGRELVRLVEQGDKLTVSAYAAAALPFVKVSSQKLSGIISSASKQLESLNDEVNQAQGINLEHRKKLSQFRKVLLGRLRRLRKIFFVAERKRRESYLLFVEEIDAKVQERFALAETRLDAVDRLNSQRQTKREEEFKRLLELFHTQLRLRAPVKLWEDRASDHDTRASRALKHFFGLTALAICSGALVPYLFGDYISSSFFVMSCDLSEPPACQQIFSAKGPLTVSGILVIFSLFLWMIRLQYRVYLSERHLSLDAREKKAFAETFLAMQEGQSVGAGNEAIVLASLFRPTQDGIINDSDTGIDLSAAAILAKQLGRP